MSGLYLDLGGSEVVGGRADLKAVNTLLGREWGTDTPFTAGDICTIFDISASTMYIVGGRGEAERFVDKLEAAGSELHHFAGKNKAAEPTPYKAMITPNTNTYGYGVEFDPKLRWEKLVVIRNAATFRLMVR